MIRYWKRPYSVCGDLPPMSRIVGLTTHLHATARRLLASNSERAF